jgi:hypothetical protein
MSSFRPENILDLAQWNSINKSNKANELFANQKLYASVKNINMSLLKCKENADAKMACMDSDIQIELKEFLLIMSKKGILQ